MPRMPTAHVPLAPMHMVLGSAAASHHGDFIVLGYCRELDEQEVARNPAHEAFVHVLHYQGGQRQLLARLPRRLEHLWRSPSGVVLAVGDAQHGVIEISGGRLSQQAIRDLPGTSACVWGVDDAHVFVCGHHQPFWLYRQAGRWTQLPLPADAPGLWAVAGHGPTDVYAAGESGVILHFDGASVQRLDSPTSRWLTCMAALPSGRLCIGGHDGTLLIGSSQGWRQLDSGTSSPLLNIVAHQRGVCYVTADGLWWFDEQLGGPHLLSRQGGRWLDRVGDQLLLVQEGRAWLFDGQRLQPLDTRL